VKTKNAGHFKTGFDSRRHILSKQECQKGYDMFIMGCILKRIPSRVQASVRKRIRAFYVGH